MSERLRWVTAAAALRRGCGAAALLGLFVMHGLAVHGAMHAGHGEHPASGPPALSVSDHGAGGTATMAASANAAFDAPEGGAPDGALLGFDGLCLALLLAGAAAALFLARLVGISGPTARSLARGWPARSRRERDPPCLFALSIQRC